MLQQKISMPNLIRNPVKNYSWGSYDPQSYVNILSTNQCSGTKGPFAELWMGMHPNGQSICQVDKSISKTLSQFLRQKYNNKIQFLLKILSIEHSLSIQVHPNKQQALALRAKKPEIYLDDNDKPEMFYTLTSFQCFLGYIQPVKFEQIMSIEPFRQIQEDMSCREYRKVIERILSLSQQGKTEFVKTALENVQVFHSNRSILHKQLQQQFPNDIGIAISMLLEYRELLKGQCFYIGAGIPHAYLKGQCIEIMKNSDNVIRLGLTPKQKDLQVIGQVLPDQWAPIVQVHPLNTNQCVRKFAESGLFLEIIHQAAAYRFQNDQVKIGLLLEGYFQIQLRYIGQQSAQVQAIKQGCIFLLEPGIEYQIDGAGTFCIGWSAF